MRKSYLLSFKTAINMKRNLKTGLLLIGLIPMIGAHTRAIPIMPDKVTVQEFTKPLDTSSEDDYLLDMASNADINVVADSTDFPFDSAVIPYPSTSGAIAGQKGNLPEHWKPFLLNVMGDFVAQKRLSILRSAPRTFLLWSEPDPRQLLNLQGELTEATEADRWTEAVAAAKANGVPEDEIIRGELPRDQLRSVLWDYLKSIEWKGTAAERNDHVDIRIPLNELPPGLRELVLLDMQNQLASDWNYKLKKDTYWNIAFAQITGNDDSEITVSYKIPDGEGGDTKFVYILTPLDAAIKAQTDAPVASMQEPEVTPVQLGLKDTMANAYSGITNKTSDSALDADVALQKPISLQVKRLSLRDLLAQMEKLGDVDLTLNADAPADKLITARVEKMPLSQLMGVLSRVYGVKWNRKGNAAYQMKGNDQGELHLKLLQIGDPERYRYRFMFYISGDRETENAAIGKAIIDQFGVEALQKPEGVAVSSLPQTLQQRMRYALEDRGAENESIMLFQTNRMMTEQLAKKDLILRFGAFTTKSYGTPFIGFVTQNPQNWLRFSVQSEDGQIVLPIFDSFYAEIAKPGETDARPPSRRR